MVSPGLVSMLTVMVPWSLAGISSRRMWGTKSRETTSSATDVSIIVFRFGRITFMAALYVFCSPVTMPDRGAFFFSCGR